MPICRSLERGIHCERARRRSGWSVPATRTCTNERKRRKEHVKPLPSHTRGMDRKPRAGVTVRSHRRVQSGNACDGRRKKKSWKEGQKTVTGCTPSAAPASASGAAPARDATCDARALNLPIERACRWSDSSKSVEDSRTSSRRRAPDPSLTLGRCPRGSCRVRDTSTVRRNWSASSDRPASAEGCAKLAQRGGKRATNGQARAPHLSARSTPTVSVALRERERNRKSSCVPGGSACGEL